MTWKNVRLTSTDKDFSQFGKRWSGEKVPSIDISQMMLGITYYEPRRNDYVLPLTCDGTLKLRGGLITNPAYKIDVNALNTGNQARREVIKRLVKTAALYVDDDRRRNTASLYAYRNVNVLGLEAPGMIEVIPTRMYGGRWDKEPSEVTLCVREPKSLPSLNKGAKLRVSGREVFKGIDEERQATAVAYANEMQKLGFEIKVKRGTGITSVNVSPMVLDLEHAVDFLAAGETRISFVRSANQSIYNGFDGFGGSSERIIDIGGYEAELEGSKLSIRGWAAPIGSIGTAGQAAGLLVDIGVTLDTSRSITYREKQVKSPNTTISHSVERALHRASRKIGNVGYDIAGAITDPFRKKKVRLITALDAQGILRCEDMKWKEMGKPQGMRVVQVDERKLLRAENE